MNNNKRTREEGAGSENTFVWEPFQKRASSPEMSKKRVSDFSDFSGPGKRLAVWSTDEEATARKRDREPHVPLLADADGWKRSRPLYWTANRKRKADSIDTVPWLSDAASKHTGTLMICSNRSEQPRLRPWGDGEENLWFGEAPLSLVPPSLFRVDPPESQIVLWQDQNMLARSGLPGPVEPELPRVEVLDSDDEDDQALLNLHSQQLENDDDGGLRPMDLND